jgi:arylsulfatase A-like enzyme
MDPLRSRNRTQALAAAVVLSLCAFACSEPGPNIVLVTFDTLRRDHVGSYGNPNQLTPNLDEIALRGLVHSNAYTSMPTTAPAHVSLFTGLYPSEHGVLSNGVPLAARFHPRELGTLLRHAGYKTAAVVASQLTSAHATGLRGFEVHDSPRGKLRHGVDVVTSALAWLDVESRRPFFLWVHLYDPHAPYGTPDDKRASFPVDPTLHGFIDAANYTDPAARHNREALYAAGVKSADRALGRLIDGIRSRLPLDPLWIFTADHGESLAEHLDERGFAFDHGKYLDHETVEIPLIVVGPGVERGHSSGTASILDIYSTILAAAGISADRTEGLLDLRRRNRQPRVVRFERRRFTARVPDSVRQHASGASDGSSFAIVGEDGRVAAEFEATSGALVESARRGLRPVGAPGVPDQIDARTRKALSELGYLE